jgi:cytochrome c556
MKNTAHSLTLIVILFLFGGYPAVAQENHTHRTGSGAQPTGTNPLIEEMVTLDGVFRDVVSAVVLGQGAQVHKALESMHGTMEKTHEGVHAGTVTLPRNNKRMPEFVKMDKQFHEKLEALALSGQRNDQKDMLSLTKQLLDRCVQCHQLFRK